MGKDELYILLERPDIHILPEMRRDLCVQCPVQSMSRDAARRRNSGNAFSIIAGKVAKQVGRVLRLIIHGDLGGTVHGFFVYVQGDPL